MCFSATASFLAAAGLTPIGLGSLQQARRCPAQLLPLAATPLLFAAQQAVEGLVWLGLTNHAPAGVVTPAALTYLGFAFAFWPVWLPWCALHLVVAGPDRWRRRCIRWLLGLGWLLASLLWLPLLLDPGRIAPIVQQGSINYQVLAPGSALVGHGPVTVLYLLVICIPLLLTRLRRLRWFAAALALAFVATQLAFLHAFSSVWCYFSAVLSLLLIWVLKDPALA